MASLGQLFVILSVAFLLANSQHLSDLNPQTRFNVQPPITKEEVLNAFIRANPDLQRLHPRLANGGLFVSVLYEDNRAIIDVYSGTNPYSGSVEVYFNGGQPFRPSGSAVSYGPGKLNLSRLTDLTTGLNLRRSGVAVTNDAQGRRNLISAFMNANPRLPSELNQKLKVKDLKRTSARLYVNASADYEGEVYVTF